jgi:hypothetical protein
MCGGVVVIWGLGVIASVLRLHVCGRLAQMVVEPTRVGLGMGGRQPSGAQWGVSRRLRVMELD